MRDFININLVLILNYKNVYIDSITATFLDK